MATKGSTTDASDELFDFLCSPCNKKDRESEAVKYCVDCQEYLCGACIESHNSFSVLAGHTFVGRSKFGKTKPDNKDLPSVPTERCKVHSLKLIDMFCAGHDSVGCHVCFTINHKPCQDIHYIPEYVETTKQTESVRKINDEIDKAIFDMDNLMKKKQKDIEDIMKTKDTCMGEIHAFRKEINETLDRLEQSSIAEIDSKFGKIEHEIQQELNKIQNTHDRLTTCKAEMESSQRNPSQHFVNMKISENIMSEMKKAESQLTGELLGKLSFDRNSEIPHFLQHLESLAQSPLPVKHGLYEVQNKKRYNVKLNDDANNCDIWSFCLLESGDILLAEFNNKNIKLFDCVSYEVKSSLKMSSMPQSVGRISGVEASVSLCNNTVQFVSTRNSIMPTRSLSFDHDCRGIAVMDGQLVICGSPKVYIYTMNGECLKTIEKDSAGSNIFNNIREICLSDNGKAIHMADEIKGLVTIDKDGNVIWKYSGHGLKDAWGVSTDGNGNVFVSGMSSQNVIQLTSDGTLVGEVVSKAHGLNRPSAISFDRKKFKLIVAERRGNELHTFHVQ